VGSLEESSAQWKEEEVIVGKKSETKSSNIKAMPAARLLAKQLNVNLNEVKATGPQGLITPEDVKKHLAQHAQTSIHGEVNMNEAEALHGVRRVMAQAMAQSHQEIVPVTVFDDVDITDWPEKLDITVHLLQAIVAAVKEEPALNAWFEGKNLQRQLIKEVNIGLAVDTKEGLFVPVIKQAESLSAKELREKIDYFKSAVQTRSVSPKELQGATITLSNFGMIAGRYATPIIVPPAVAIIGCGRSREVVIPRNGQITIGRMMPLSLTFDHRAVTGGEATRFLGALIKHLEKS
jgi:2-oxoisovalerate dehydrogenase E2 component (dihydrolipoyl transacylase)